MENGKRTLPQRRVQLLANSGCDMPPEKAAALGFTLIPDLIIFGQRQYRNTVDIDCPVFYRMLAQAQQLPTSSHPSAGDFLSAFLAAPPEQEVLCMTVTSQMSGTWSTAMAARALLAEQAPEKRVFVYDSRQVSHGMGLMMAAAARFADLGLGAEEIMARLDHYQKQVGVYFVLESLKNARKGGRVGAIKALAADALGVKPLLTFADGTVRDVGIARGFRDGMRGVLRHYAAQADKTAPCIVFHADNLSGAERLAGEIRAAAPGAPVELAYVGSVIGIYTGAGCVGVAFSKALCG